MGQPRPSRFPDRRRSELARIHIGAKQLVGDDTEAYRDMLEAVTGERSAAGLDERERGLVLRHLAACGVRFERPAPAPSDADDPGDPGLKARPARPRPRPELAPYIKTIDALCINHPGGRKPRAWAEAILRNMTKSGHRTPLEWASAGQLQEVARAIRVDIRRCERRQGRSGGGGAA